MTISQRRDEAPAADSEEHGPAKWFRRNPAFNLAYRIGVGIVGGIVLAVGIVMIPYPGPGWLVVFAGLAILATEFSWAGRVLEYAKDRYDEWLAWLKRQPTSIKLLVFAGTCLVVIVMCWALGAFELAGGWVGIDESWLQSPIL